MKPLHKVEFLKKHKWGLQVYKYPNTVSVFFVLQKITH